MDVSEIIDPLRVVLKFEKEMKSKHELMIAEERSRAGRSTIGSLSSDADDDGEEDEDDEDDDTELMELTSAVSSIDGAVSSAFEGYLGGYVTPLKQRMVEFLERIVDEEELLVVCTVIAVES